jgi:3,4-dihydroxy-2-butanone 4-phosphate synthase
MTSQPPGHIEPSRHSTDEVDEFLRHTEGNVDVSKGAGSPAIKPTTELGDDGKPDNDTPKNPET